MNFEFKSQLEVVETLFLEYFKKNCFFDPSIEIVNLSLKQDENYKSDGYTQRFFLKVEYKKDKISYNVVYTIYRSSYFNCCGVANLNSYSNYFTEHKAYGLGYILPLMMCQYTRILGNHNLVTMTIPIKTQENAWKIAQKMLSVMGGSHYIFKNDNTSREIAHVQLLNQPFKKMQSVTITDPHTWDRLKKDPQDYRKYMSNNEKGIQSALLNLTFLNQFKRNIEKK